MGGVPVVLELVGVLGTDVRGGFGTVPTVGLGGWTLASAVCSSFSASSSCFFSASRLSWAVVRRSCICLNSSWIRVHSFPYTSAAAAANAACCLMNSTWAVSVVSTLSPLLIFSRICFSPAIYCRSLNTCPSRLLLILSSVLGWTLCLAAWSGLSGIGGIWTRSSSKLLAAVLVASSLLILLVVGTYGRNYSISTQLTPIVVRRKVSYG